MDMGALILLVEDEADLASTLAYNLAKEGFSTRLAADGASALEAVRQTPAPDLVLLDLMLPDIPGTDVCREIRATPQISEVPIMMLTAKGDEIDRVVGFELGADDYVTKPYSLRELMLRIQALLRRSAPANDAPKAELSNGEIHIDRVAYRATIAGEEITLTPLEFKLLALLVERKGRVQSRERLLADVWGIRSDTATRTVDTHVKRLREKLGEAGSCIQTLRGVGYRLAATKEA